MPRFQRARKPEEKEVRRRAILEAARDLAREVGPMDLGLNALGRRSGVSKPNIYRYFEGREDVLLRLYTSELADVVAALEARLGTVASIGEVASVLASEHLARPLLCQLAGMVSSILEHNLSAEAIASSKAEMLALVPRAVGALRRSLPWLGDEDAWFALRAVELHLAALWPMANPSRAAREVLSRPEFAALIVDAGRDYPRFIEVLLEGLRAKATAARQPAARVAGRPRAAAIRRR